MARPEKVAVVREVSRRLAEAPATMLTEYRGLSVVELQELRTKLRESGAEYKVVKNTLTRLAAREAGMEVPDELLLGPTAVTFCGDDPVAAAKVLRAFSREHPELIVKGSIFEGSLLSAEDTLKLAELASREELLARLAGLFAALVAQLARRHPDTIASDQPGVVIVQIDGLARQRIGLAELGGGVAAAVVGDAFIGAEEVGAVEQELQLAHALGFRRVPQSLQAGRSLLVEHGVVLPRLDGCDDSRLAHVTLAVNHFRSFACRMLRCGEK